MQRSKPERASAVDVSASLEDVFASRSFGKPIPDALGMEPASAMADVLGPRAAGIVKNRFIATVSVAAAALSLVVVAASTGTVKVPTLSAQNAGAPGQSNPDFSNPAFSGSGTGATGSGSGGSAGTSPAGSLTQTTSSPGGVPVSTTQGSANATVADFTPSSSGSGTAPASVALNVQSPKAPTTPTTVPPAATTTTTAPPVTTTTTTTTPPTSSGGTGNAHRGQFPSWGGSGNAVSCGTGSGQSNANVVQTCP
jgi:hypothetical protein